MRTTSPTRQIVRFMWYFACLLVAAGLAALHWRNARSARLALQARVTDLESINEALADGLDAPDRLAAVTSWLQRAQNKKID